MDLLRIALYACIALTLALVAADIAAVTAGSEPPELFEFTSSDGNVTFVGLRVGNARPGDRLVMPGLSAPEACGRTTVESPDGPVAATGQVEFYSLPSARTPDLLAGRSVEGMSLVGQKDSANMTASSSGFRDLHPGLCRTVRLELDPVPSAAGEPTNGTDLLVRAPRGGMDFVYVVRAADNDPAVYAQLSEALVASAAEWQRFAGASGSVLHEGARDADAVLRPGAFAVAAVTLVTIVLLAFRQRRARKATDMAAGATEVSVDLANAGEGHLLRLRNAWVLVGLLLLATLAGLTMLAIGVISSLSNLDQPRGDWEQQILLLAFVVDAVAIGAWVAAYLRLGRELAAWRAAWARLRHDPDLGA